jgi:TonB family protein
LPAVKRSSVTLETTDFPFAYYLQQLQRKVNERWVPPAPGVEGLLAVVLFEIGRNGWIGPPAVERGSGSALYDRAALRAVTESSPFPPLPQEFSATSLRVHLGFEVSTPLTQGPGRP